MKYVYFPSCNFTKALPEVSERIKAFLSTRGVEVTGCCRLNHAALTPDCVALTICQTCRIIIEENCPGVRVMSVFEYLDGLDDFPFPDYGGEAITVQDCYRAREHAGEKAAVRSLLKKMNFQVVELPGRDEEVNFDGAWMFRPVMEFNRKLAPKTFGRIEKDLNPQPPEWIDRYLRDYCARFKTNRVACYCNSCLGGLNQGLPEGKEAVHLARLLFPET